MRVLKLDIAGNPSDWINVRQAIHLIVGGQSLAGLGDTEHVAFGGVNAHTDLRSQVVVNSILLTTERVHSRRHAHDYVPPLTNDTLFSRDSLTCQYCGKSFSPRLLSRDHIIPTSRGGLDVWTNVTTACKRCNHLKNDRTPEEWGTLLLSVPFAPNWSEMLYLANRLRIIEDQRRYLVDRFKHPERLAA